ARSSIGRLTHKSPPPGERGGARGRRPSSFSRDWNSCSLAPFGLLGKNAHRRYWGDIREETASYRLVRGLRRADPEQQGTRPDRCPRGRDRQSADRSSADRRRWTPRLSAAKARSIGLT